MSQLLGSFWMDGETRRDVSAAVFGPERFDNVLTLSRLAEVVMDISRQRTLWDDE